jgi:acetyl esterase/lipase
MKKRLSFLFIPITVFFLFLLFSGKPDSANQQDKFDVIKDIEYAKIGDVSNKLDLYIPKNDGSKPLPLIIFIHGGGWLGGDKAKPYIPIIPTVEKGYINASINYRLSNVAKFPACVEDCKSAVRWLRANAKKYNINPDKIGVWGESAGGHLSLMVGCADTSAGFDVGDNLKVSSRVQAVISVFGPADF